MIDADSIAAIATPPGRSALATLRLAGHDALAIAGRVAAPWPIVPRQATLCAIRDPISGELLDRGILVAYAGPRSFTGEDLVEFTVHGGATVATAVLAALVAAGAREAMPGEFTRRAVLNGKLDLVQAEAIGDLIDARTGAARRVALTQADGGLSRRIAALRDDILGLDALLAYDIDFPEEDDGPIPRTRVTAAADLVRAGLVALLDTARTGALVRDGATVVIAGPPNAGKSSLFNALLGEERAIVTEVPGTTRDAIEALLDARPLPLRLVDTAGLRESEDLLERLGIEVSERWLARAHLVLACGDTPEVARATAAALASLTSAPVLVLRTKADDAGAGVVQPDDFHSVGPAHDDADLREARSGSTMLAVSAHTGAGVRALLDTVQLALASRYAVPDDGAPVVSRARHRRALEEAVAEIDQFREAWSMDQLPAPVAAVHVRAAATALETLIGAVDVEEVLGRVFSDFCVGK